MRLSQNHDCVLACVDELIQFNQSQHQSKAEVFVGVKMAKTAPPRETREAEGSATH
jgi:hypothetical protein